MTKHHNWMTGPNHKVVDLNTDRLATEFLGCNHLTPAVEAKLDAMFKEMERNNPTPEEEQTTCEPNDEIAKLMAAPRQPDWADTVKPPPEAFKYDDALEVRNARVKASH